MDTFGFKYIKLVAMIYLYIHELGGHRHTVTIHLKEFELNPLTYYDIGYSPRNFTQDIFIQ